MQHARSNFTIDGRTEPSDQPDGPSFPRIMEELLVGQGGVSIGEQPSRVRGPAQAAQGSDALSKQVGGGHYKSFAIQPIEYIHRNGLDYLAGNVVKYVSRHKAKNGAADIRKAIHYLELILSLQYGEDA